MAMMGIKEEMILQRIGNIKMGMKGPEKKKQSGDGTYRIPMKLDHFIVTTMERDENDDWVPDSAAMKILGKKPTELPVFVPYDNPWAIFPHEFAWWTASRRQCHGNGEIAMRFRDDSNEEFEMPCVCEKFTEEKVCKKRGILNVMLEISGKIGGVHQLRTSSSNTIRNIKASLALLRTLTGGPLAGIPLTLTIQELKVHPPGAKGAVTIYVAGLEFRADTSLKISTVAQLQGYAQTQVQARISVGTDIKALEVATESGLNADESADGQDWEEEFLDPTAQGADPVDVETEKKTGALKGRLAATKKSAEPEKSSDEPSKDEQEGISLVESIEEMMKSPLLSKKAFGQWTDWLAGDRTLEQLRKGKDSLTTIIKRLGEADKKAAAAKKTGRPSNVDLTKELLDVLAIGNEEDLVTDDEAKAVMDEADKNQKTQWLKDKKKEWLTAINERREMRKQEAAEAAQGDGPPETGQQSLA